MSACLRYLLFGILCLVLLPPQASAQGISWETHNEAGNQFSQQGKYAEALFRRALAIIEKVVGPDHPKVAATLESYADLLRKTNREYEALKMEARTNAIRALHAQQNPTK